MMSPGDSYLSEEWNSRACRLQDQLNTHNLAGVLLLDRVSLYYYFGTIPGGAGYIPREGEPVLFVRRGFERAHQESFFPTVPIRSFRDMASFLSEKGWPDRHEIGLEADRITLSLYRMVKKYFPDFEFVDIAQEIRQQRAMKSEYELEILKEAGLRAAHSFQQLPAIIQRTEPKTELAIMSEFEAVMRRAGHQGPVRLHAFNSEIYFGAFSAGDSANASTAFDGPVGTPGLSAAAPFLCSMREIRVDEPIMVDIVFGYEGYQVDQTRIFVLGSLPDELVRAHAVAMNIQDQLALDLRPNQPARELYRRAVEIARDQGLLDQFMGSPANRVSFIGHGVGLELDEAPVLSEGSKDLLQENMVIALEPKFFFAGRGGVGIENTYRVTKNGGERLTPLPDDIIGV
ncbi:aminopeptidase P family protein [bacterium]|nr:aminopeptidase P family protein [bacterium]